MRMNRIAARAAALLLLILALAAGVVFFLGEYIAGAEDWVMFSGSPHVYSGGNIGCGTVTDRDGELLLDMNGQRKDASLESLGQSTVHWLGDRRGNIDAPALSQYAFCPEFAAKEAQDMIDTSISQPKSTSA